MKKLCIVFIFLWSFMVFVAAQETEVPRKPLIPVPDSLHIDYLDLAFRGDLGFKEESLFNTNNLRMDYLGGNLAVVADLSMSNDQQYAPVRAMLPSGNFLGYYFLMNEGGLSYTLGNATLGNFSLQGGRFRQYDIVDSPYSLFLNSLGHSANTVNFKYESIRFIYQTRWIELNSRSGISTPAWNEYHWRQEQEKPLGGRDQNWDDRQSTYYPNTIGFPDRGANYKIYALKVNDWRLGFLDAAVYTGRSFDFEYFLNPIPQYFIQYVKGTPGRPWTTDSNENNLFGLFWDIDRKQEWNAYAQILIDDFSLGFLKFIYDGFNDNPWKFAWAFGGRIHTPYGRFGFHQGGALKYTFEPIGSPEADRHSGDDAMTAYGYTYYPETRYFDDEDNGKVVSIVIEDNMLGYKHGENNIAFLIDYQNRFYNFLVNAELELSITGNSSPANPWHDYTHQSEAAGTHFLDDGTVETHLELRANVSRRIGHWSFYAATAIGGLFNKLKLEKPDAPSMYTDKDSGVSDTIYIWKPSNEHQFIFRLSLGVKYTLEVL